MQIYATDIRPIDVTRQVTSFILTDDAGVARSWHANTPILSGAELQAHLDSQVDEYWCGLMRKEYREADLVQQPGETLRQAWERWIAAGCVNPDETVIERASYQVVTREDYRLTLRSAQRSYIDAHYDQYIRESLQAIYADPLEAQAKKDSIRTVWEWIKTVTVEYCTRDAQIADPGNAAWASVSIDFSTFDASDPGVELLALMVS